MNLIESQLILLLFDWVVLHLLVQYDLLEVVDKSCALAVEEEARFVLSNFFLHLKNAAPQLLQPLQIYVVIV